MSTKILHISDLHFGPPFVPVVAAALLQTVPSLAPDVIVVSGDLTQRAKRAQFDACKQFFGRLPSKPMLVVPGNHDVPLHRVFERLFRPHALYREIIHPDLNPVLQVGNVVLVGLDSTVPEDMTRIVVAHHHFAPGHDKVFDVQMPGARRAIDCFVEQKVEMILGGHLHRSYIGNSLDFFPGHNRARGVVIVQCGTSTSSRGRGRERDENTFNLIEVGTDTLVVTHYLYFEVAGKFAAISKYVYPRQGRTLDADDGFTPK
jgi:3',5'-cyclic AMP phosphodiesterase CpdA